MSKQYVTYDSQLLSSQMACPCLCDIVFNRNLRGKSGKSNSLECGSIAHFILEHYNKALIAGNARDLAITKGFEAGREYINGYKPTNQYMLDKDYEGLRNTSEESTTKPSRIGWKHVLNTMEEYFRFWSSDSWTPLSAEEVRKKVIYSDDELEILWKAKFDVIVDTPHGIYSKDYKTMSQRRPTMMLNNQFIGQAILMGTNGVIVEKIGWQKSLAPEEKFERVMVSYSADKLAEWANEIVPYYARMLLAYNEAGNYPRNYTHCEGKFGPCFALPICEAERNMREEVIANDYVVGKPWDIQND